jgi:hypothetical protein
VSALAEALFDVAPTVAERGHGGAGPGGGPTLEGLLSGAWEGLSARASVSCPICSGRMGLRSGSRPAPAVGRCDDCGAELR